MRARGDNGASLIEFAIIVPILAMFLFGIIDFGSAYNDLQSLRQGAREAARRAVTDDFGSNSSCVVTGGTPSSATRKIICATKDHIGLDAASTRVKVAFPSGYDEKQPLLVCVQYPLDSVTNFFAPVLDGHIITAKVQMRIEEEDATAPVAFAETSPSGGNWSWCTAS